MKKSDKSIMRHDEVIMMRKKRTERIVTGRHSAIVAPQEADGIRFTRIIGNTVDRESGVTIRSHSGYGHGGQDAITVNQRYGDCIDHVDHACDPSARRNRLQNIIAGAKQGDSKDFGSLIRLAIRSAHQEIRDEAWRSLLEHFSDKEGLPFFIAMHAERAEIRHGAIDRMLDKDSQTKYFLDLTMKESRSPETKWYAFCASMKIRFGEEYGETMAEAIGLEDRVRRNKAAYSLAQDERKDLLETVGNESHFEDTRKYAIELAKIVAKERAKTA